MAESKMINNQLIVSFTLPLVNTKKYILFKSTILPVLIKDNLYHFIVPHHEYVPLDKVRDKYIPITNKKLKQCIQLAEVDLICKETFPIMSAIGTNICEINLLRMDKVADECNIRIAHFTSEMWIKVRHPNTYVFVFPKKQWVYISCLTNHDQFIEGTGIIYLEPGCKIKTNNLMLSEIENFKIPEIDYPNIINYGEHNTLNGISFGLKEIQEMETKLIYKLAPSDLKNNISWLFNAIIIIVIIVMIIYIRYFYKKGKKIHSCRLKTTSSNIFIDFSN